MPDLTVSRRVVLGGGLATIATPALAGPAPAAERAAVAPLRIGVLLDTSGPAAIHGQRQLLGVRYQAEVINAGRGDVVRLFVRDTQGDVDITRAHARELLHRYEVDAVVGTSLVPTAIPVMELAQAAGVPM